MYERFTDSAKHILVKTNELAKLGIRRRRGVGADDAGSSARTKPLGTEVLASRGNSKLPEIRAVLGRRVLIGIPECPVCVVFESFSPSLKYVATKDGGWMRVDDVEILEVLE